MQSKKHHIVCVSKSSVCCVVVQSFGLSMLSDTTSQWIQMYNLSYQKCSHVIVSPGEVQVRSFNFQVRTNDSL
jgi:hypothetical protein